jgi:putative ABC transport system permease protein
MVGEPRWRRYLRFWGTDVRRDVDDEVAFHLEMREREYEALGWSSDAARAEARRRFGDAAAVRAACYTIGERRLARWQRVAWRAAFGHDLRQAVRAWRRQPGLTAVVALTLGLGVGVNAVMFGAIDRLLLRPPAGVREPERVKRLHFTQTFSWAGRVTEASASYLDYDLLRGAGSVFDAVAAFAEGQTSLGLGATARPVRWTLATPEYFGLLGVHPALGRLPAPGDEAADGAVAVLGYGFWQRELGGDPHVLGRALTLAGKPFTVIGVAARGFTGVGTEPSDVWVPLRGAAREYWEGIGLPGDPGEDLYRTRSFVWLTILARWRPGIPLARADAEATVLFRRSLALDAERTRARRGPAGRSVAVGGVAGEEEVDPTAAVRLASIIPGRAQLGLGGDDAQRARVALWLVAMAGVVLLIACANVANLLLARSLSRRRELAVRLALGMSRGRLVWQLLVECFLLAAVGSVVAALFARLSGGVLRGMLLPEGSAGSLALDRRVLLVTLAVAGAAALLAGVVPALQASRPDVVEALKSGGAGVVGARGRLRRGLLVLQAALSVVLLVGAGLFLRSVRAATTQDMGYDPRTVLVATVNLSLAGYSDAAKRELYRTARERVSHLPGVVSASIGTAIPFRLSFSDRLIVPGRDSIPTTRDGGPYDSEVTPEYFTTLGTRILRGRGFTSADAFGAPRVAIVSETMARLLWPHDTPLGKCIKVRADTAPCSEIVGVAQDTHRQAIEPTPVMQYYLPLDQRQIDRTSYALFIRAAGDPMALIGPVRRTIQSLSSDLPYAHVVTLQSLIDPSTRSWRLGERMFGLFGALALVIAAVGVLGVMSYEVSRRTREIAVRLAVGAGRGDIFRLVIGDAARLTGAGLAIGALLAAGIARFVRPLLFQTSPHDPVVFGVVGVVLLVVGVVASVLPAHRATRVDPLSVMRAD